MKIRNGETILDLYQIDGEPVESGNTARIWKALHKEWNINLALKQPRTEFIVNAGGMDNFYRECNTWIKLGHHPHIVPCFYVRRIDNELIVFSDWCEGGSLKDGMDKNTIYSGTKEEQEQHVISIALQSMLGLRYAHKMGVIHKDIKPANIMLTSNGAVRITDFGSSDFAGEMVTQRYLSPEQLMNDTKKITYKTDIFSWALTVSAMHCGNCYWHQVGFNSDEYFEFKLPEFKIAMRPEYAELIKSCLAPEPDDRPDAETVVRRIREIYADVLEKDIALNYIDEEYAEETADSLNNAALSYLDIDEYEKSEMCWKKALLLQPDHPESIYNYNVYLWKNGRIDDNELSGKIKLISSPERNEFLEEINCYSGIKLISSLISSRMFEVDNEECITQAGWVDSIHFSKDGSRILASSKEDDCHKIWDIAKGECISVIPYNELTESVLDEKWNKSEKSCGNIVLEGNENKLYSELRDIKIKDDTTGCVIATLQYDRYYNFSFSGDGKMLAISDSNGDITVYQLAEQGMPKPALCRFMPSDELLENKHNFTRLKADFEKCIEFKEYKTAVKIVSKIAEIPVYGSSAEYRNMKKSLFPFCKRSGFRALSTARHSEGVHKLRFNHDGKLFLKIGVQQYFDFTIPDNCIYVYETDNFKKTIKCIYIENEHGGTDHTYVEDAWFTSDGKICFCTRTVTIKYENLAFSSVSSLCKKEKQIKEYDFKTDKIRTLLSESEKSVKHSIPTELIQFCKECGYHAGTSDINPDYTTLIAGNENEFAVFDIDCDIEYDEEKVNAYKNASEEKRNYKENFIAMYENNNYKKCNSTLINDNNRFLLEMAEGKANELLEQLSAMKLTNPSTTFQQDSKMAKAYLDSFPQGQIPPPHPNPAIELLLRASDEEFTAMMDDIKRQAKYWAEESELLLTTVLMRTIAGEKPEDAPISFYKIAKKYGISLFKEENNICGFNEYNSFLSIINEDVFHYFNKLSAIRLLNPYNEFSMKVQGAMYWNSNHAPDEKSDDSEIKKLIDMGQEEFDESVRENERQAYFWHGSFDESFLTLLLRTLDPAENEEAKKVMKKENRFPDFTHRPDTIVRRHDYLPVLIEKVQKMREALLENIMGQDHAVHGFCEGIFNSEVFLQADEERKRPRAVFTFAGPPGVGKTYLAEQAAKYLGRPFKRFDMTEYSAHDAHLGLIGFESTWKHAAPGILTTFVSENPECVLLFDEIEKAHPQVIQIFYQMLDAGIVTDKFNSTANGEIADANNKKANVSFKDTIIIFTTNAGRSLYEGEYGDNCAGVPTKTVLNALKTEINPLTGQSFFPAAIVSRIATGYPILFNNLKPHHLVSIVKKEINRVQELFEKQYGIRISADEEAVMSLLYSEGGAVDARALRARVELFFKNEFFKIISSDTEGITDVTDYDFCTETDNLPAEVNKIFKRDTTPEILLYANRMFGEICQRQINGFIFHATTDIDEAIRIAGEKDISFAVIDIAKRSYNEQNDSAEYEGTMLLSMAASGWKDGKKLFSTLRTRLPELPIYILESTMPLNDDIVSAFERAGARGKLAEPTLRGYTNFENQLMNISDQLYMQNVANDLAAERKAIYFETAPKKQENEIKVMLRNFELRQAPDADDADDLMSEAEKPKERFDRVIGAKNAKDELKFFVDFLKNPKKFAAQGHRMPKGVLLYGKPGTGKTMLAKAVAGEAGLAFFPAVASSFVKQYTGTGPAAVRVLFKKARRYAPSIIFIDEVDTIARPRTDSEYNQAEENTLNALLAEMDGFAADNKRPVFVLAATNFGIEAGDGGIGVLDEAFVRRFDRKIKIELPDKDERKQLINLLVSKIEVHNVTEDAIENIASRSVGTSPAILTNVIETAKRMAFNAGKPVDDEILTEAYEVTKHGDKKSWGEETLRQTACHECGHAILNYLAGNTPSYLTIEARGNFGGYMEHSEEEKERNTFNKKQLLDMIRTSLGGRAAEIVCFGEEEGMTTGISADIRKATQLATSMITCYAMDEKLGLAYMSDSEAEKSSEVRQRVNEILTEQLNEAIRLINENRDKFDRLCEALLAKNRLTDDEIEELLKDK